MRPTLTPTLILAALLAAEPALAHTGHGTSGFAAGLSHPVFGLDHLLAMVAVGLWAALSAPGRFWIAPAGFLAGMLGGGLAGFAGFEPPAMEAMITGSVVLFGALALAAARMPAPAAFALAALFGAAHGAAHGAELPEGLNAVGYAAGFMIATAALHAAGVAVALAARRAELGRVAQAGGGAVALGGALLMLG